MKKVSTAVLVIGGGATGTGVARDLAMRGVKTILVERRDLSHGTTGRYHGLLHSGGRYVVKDPQAARECIEENRILRKIMPHCIEDTGGFFVVTPTDESSYAERFIQGCRSAGIPVEDVPISTMLKEEPALNPGIQRCLRVPDASADSFLAADVTAESARQHGAQILTYHEVRGLVKTHERVVGAMLYDLVRNEEIELSCDLVVNASGAWAGKLAATIGLVVQIKPGKGTMVAINHRIVNTVINRCKMPSDGDILVPAHTVAVMGTTDEQVADPDKFAIEPWEIQLMMEEGEKIIPGFKNLRFLRAWAGVRPLYQETTGNTSRDITRAFVLLDHATRDGVEGLVTITSGKWTTHRKMAEVTVDKVCQKLQISYPCRTHLEILPALNEHGVKHHYLGSRLASIEKTKAFNQLICECELATRSEVEQAIRAGANTIDDIRRDTRLGMGPCQGGFCTLRAAGLLHKMRQPPVHAVNAALRDYLQERWKGILPILWGQQLRQERLDELIYLDVLNIDHLPGDQSTPLAADNYAPPTETAQTGTVSEGNFSLVESDQHASPINPLAAEVLVIGAGLAGLSAAWFTSRQGLKTRLVSKGWGALFWGSGCIDVLGYLPDDPEAENNLHLPVISLRSDLEQFVRSNPNHLYARLGLQTLGNALVEFQALCSQAGYPLLAADGRDILGQNWLLPTTAGSLRPTCLAPITMISGDCRPDSQGKPIVLVGFRNFEDFSPTLAAANLEAQSIPALGVHVELPSLENQHILTSRTIAQALEKPDMRTELVEQIKSKISEINRPGFAVEEIRVGLPGILGTQPDYTVWQDIHDRLHCPIFELAGLPPSFPGIRLHQILKNAIEAQQGQVLDGMLAVQSISEEKVLKGIFTEAAARRKLHSARDFILASGGFLGGGFTGMPDGAVYETIFGLPVSAPGSRSVWFNRNFLTPAGHPLFLSGLVVNQNLQPVDQENNLLFGNLYTVGGLFASVDSLRERSLEGVALASAYAASQAIAKKITGSTP